ncbi:MAG: B12-binding domain-containing radical SAM protein [Promethearchaeota archaeon]
MTKRIFFILPDHRRYSGNFSTFILPGLSPTHIGTLIIGEMLRKRGYTVKIFDEKIFPVSLNHLKDADVVGISISTISALRGYELAFNIRKTLKIPVVIGGVHATLNTEEALKWANFVVRNEGEYTMLELMETFDNGKNFDDILGLSFKTNGEIYHNPQRPFIKDLDQLPYPNWNLIENMYRYLQTPLNNFVYFTQVTRGCPFNCSFCSVTPSFGKPLRFRSVENVILELKSLPKQTQKLLFFYDDNFVANKKYTKELLTAMIENDCVPYAWHSQMRADASEDDELMNLMAQTNCKLATFGFESVNPMTLKAIKKGQTIDLIENCVEKMHDKKILINGFFVLGSDEDTLKNINDTVQFALEKKIDFAAFMPLTPFPGTPFYEEMKDRIFTKNWELYDVQHVVYYPKNMTPLELYLGCLDAYKSFYHPRTYAQKKFSQFIFAFYGWSLRCQLLYKKELIANKKYIEFLNLLPPKEQFNPELIEEFKYVNEKPILHHIFSNRFFKIYWRKIIRGKQKKGAAPNNSTN